MGGRRTPLSADERLEVSRTLQKNKLVPYVARILSPSGHPVQKNDDGSVSSHLLSWGESGGRYFVYPELQSIEGKLVRHGDPGDALERGNVVWFDEQERAERFAGGAWKDVMGIR